MKIKNDFIEKWNKYFPGAELPVVFFYTDEPGDAGRMPAAEPPPAHRCIMADLARVRRGKTICLEKETTGCGGARRYCGFDPDLHEGFEYFLSCGIPGKMEGERYKKTPEIVKELMINHPGYTAPGKYIVFKPWADLAEDDEPEAVIFFAKPDVLSGLFTLSGYAESDVHGVISPFGAGCATIVEWPYQEQQSERPRSVIGMFDVSARPYVEPDVLTISVPMKKFTGMVADMDESFLITDSWNKIKKRL